MINSFNNSLYQSQKVENFFHFLLGESSTSVLLQYVNHQKKTKTCIDLIIVSSVDAKTNFHQLHQGEENKNYRPARAAKEQGALSTDLHTAAALPHGHIYVN